MPSACEALVADLADKAAAVERGGPEEARAAPSWRAASCCRASGWPQLLDPGSPFLEIGQFAAWGMYGGDIAAAGHDRRRRPRRGPAR